MYSILSPAALAYLLLCAVQKKRPEPFSVLDLFLLLFFLVLILMIEFYCLRSSGTVSDFRSGCSFDLVQDLFHAGCQAVNFLERHGADRHADSIIDLNGINLLVHQRLVEGIARLVVH